MGGSRYRNHGSVGAIVIFCLVSLMPKAVTAFVPPSPAIFSTPKRILVADGVTPGVTTSTSTALWAVNAKKPFSVIVKAKIDPNRMDEFLSLIETNAKASRQEPGCLRFDVLRSQDTANEFFFYELYQDAAAVDFHKTQDHYNLWADFKASGGALESISYKANGEFLT
jgi:(4S)-4-hydroxy-5-phosphonooxypentane-2,3-dione isomerase